MKAKARASPIVRVEKALPPIVVHAQPSTFKAIVEQFTGLKRKWVEKRTSLQEAAEEEEEEEEDDRSSSSLSDSSPLTPSPNVTSHPPAPMELQLSNNSFDIHALPFLPFKKPRLKATTANNNNQERCSLYENMPYNNNMQPLSQLMSSILLCSNLTDETSSFDDGPAHHILFDRFGLQHY